jgi:hypothetical protein
LPVPFGPISTTLVVSLTNLSDISSSTASRSQHELMAQNRQADDEEWIDREIADGSFQDARLRRQRREFDLLPALSARAGVPHAARLSTLLHPPMPAPKRSRAISPASLANAIHAADIIDVCGARHRQRASREGGTANRRDSRASRRP